LRLAVWIGFVFFWFDFWFDVPEPIRSRLRSWLDAGDVRIYSGGIAGSFAFLSFEPTLLFLFLSLLLGLFPRTLVSSSARVSRH